MINSDQNRDAVHLDDDRLNEYLDGYLDLVEIVIFKTHLAGCASCAARLQSLQTVFVELEALPDVSLERDLSLDIMAALQPGLKFSRPLKTTLIVQVVLALILFGWALPSLVKTWQPWLNDLQLTWSQQYPSVLLNRIADWNAQWIELQSAWMRLLTTWQPPTLIEATQIVVWPIFLVAVLLFVIGNGLILSRVTRRGSH